MTTVGALERRDLAGRLRGPGLVIRSGPLAMRVGTAFDELVDPIALLYGDFPLVPDDEFHDFDVRVDASPRSAGALHGRARAFIDGRGAFDPFRRRHALPMFEWAVNWCVFTRPNQYLLLHSAVVERGGHAIFLSGRPGAGKSTLTAGLVATGWRLFSDEVAVLTPGAPDVLPLPRPVGLKNDSIDIVRRAWPGAVIGPAVEGTRKGTVAHLAPPADSVRRAAEPARPRWILFPEFLTGSKPEAERVTRGEALQRLGHESFNYSLLGSVGFETLAAAVGGCRAYRVRFGDLDSALALAGEIASESW